MKAVLYRRVSKADGSQTTENQRLALDGWRVAHPDAAVVAEIEDMASSGQTRPGKERAIRMLRKREADTVVIWKLDRWARSTSEFTLEIDEAMAAGWNIVSLTDMIDLSTPAGRAMVRMMAVFAELERDLIRERTILGKARAAAEGKHDGRPTKEMLRRGWTPGKPCAPFGCRKHLPERAAA